MPPHNSELNCPQPLSSGGAARRLPGLAPRGLCPLGASSAFTLVLALLGGALLAGGVALAQEGYLQGRAPLPLRVLDRTDRTDQSDQSYRLPSRGAAEVYGPPPPPLPLPAPLATPLAAPAPLPALPPSPSPSPPALKAPEASTILKVEVRTAPAVVVPQPTLLTPQMLVPYFQRAATNSLAEAASELPHYPNIPDTLLHLPVLFSPPEPFVAAPRSSASYQLSEEKKP